MVDARQIDGDVSITQNKVTIGNSSLHFEGVHPRQFLLKKKDESIVNINFSLGTQEIIEINEANFSNINFFYNDLEQITMTQHGANSYIKIDNHKTADGLVVDAWYNVKKKSFLFPKFEPSVNYDTSEIQLLGVIDGQVYYYDPKQKKVLYQLNSDAITISLAAGIKNAYFKDDFIFAEHEDGFGLLLQNPIKKSLIQISQANFSLEFISNNNYLKSNNISLDKFVRVTNSDGNVNGWFINTPDKILKVNVTATDLANQNLVGFINSKEENILNSYFFYDQVQKILKIQKGENGVIENVSLNDIVQVITVGTEPIAIKQDGSIYHFDLNGQPILVGMNQTWIDQNKNIELKSAIENMLLNKPNHTDTLFLVSKDNYMIYNINKKSLSSLFH
ncbi:TcdA/TcdB pore-forming domain-containing protein [Fluviispira multicolorata]|uniref:TcdA/TcdB pore-forming domain-containing protein n=1 Tax=Fluviispira multicolorata TaxID=2654512 RepID=UPI0024837716|nr:TcdA/TcdB pore-forming domain-containing protein [Fluviispira multicolorata]